MSGEQPAYDPASGVVDDGTTDMYSFTLLDKLKTSIQSYDQSLKGFLGANNEERFGWFGADEERMRAERESLEIMLEQQRRNYQKQLDQTRENFTKEKEEAVNEQKQKYEEELEQVRVRAERLSAELNAAEAIKEHEARESSDKQELQEQQEANKHKIDQLRRGWLLERQQAELVKQAMAEQHRQQIAAVRATSREKMAAMQTELVRTMEMLETMYNGWQTSLEDAVKEMKQQAEEDRRNATERVRQQMGEKLVVTERKVEELRVLYEQEHQRRKQNHNQLIELTGNIRVLCRVRPIVEAEVAAGAGINTVEYPMEGGDDALIVKQRPTRRTSSANGDTTDDFVTTPFEFDAVLRAEASQDRVFSEVKPLVTSCMDGFSVTIFAYGQTGSGKTYTMEGNKNARGLSVRTFEELFHVRDKRAARVKYTFKMSMLEIYNEQVRDLLGGENGSADTGAGGGRKKEGGTQPRHANIRRSLDIRVTSEGIDVPGLSVVDVESAEECLEAIRKGSANRAVGQHSMNEHSSRSHLCIRLTIDADYLDQDAMTHAKLYLIDLAGSERVSKTSATGERLKEAQAINKSLSALGNVMQALGANTKTKGTAKHVPFRDSKLTNLLQDSLTGGSKVMMIVNVSPAEYNVSETLSSLNFAARCRAIELGKAPKNEESPETVGLKRENVKLKNELTQTKKTLETKSGELFESEKREAQLKQTMVEAMDNLKTNHEAGEELLKERQRNIEQLMESKHSLEADVTELNAAVKELEERLVSAKDEAKEYREALATAEETASTAFEAKQAAAARCGELEAEVRSLTKELNSEKAQRSKSETSQMNTLKTRLDGAIKAQNEAKEALGAAQKTIEELHDKVSMKDERVREMEDDLAHSRAEYSALVAKYTVEKQNGQIPGAPPNSESMNLTAVKATAGALMQPSVPLLTETHLGDLRAAQDDDSDAISSLIPRHKLSHLLPDVPPLQADESHVPKLYVPSAVVEEHAEREASGAAAGGARGGGKPQENVFSGQDAAERLRTAGDMIQRAKSGSNMSLTSSPPDDLNDDLEISDESSLRTSRTSDVSSVGPSASEVPSYQPTLPEDAEDTVDHMDGGDMPSDAEFAAFQAQFVVGTTILLRVGNKKPKPKKFAITFQPKKGLVLTWGKSRSVPLSDIVEVVSMLDFTTKMAAGGSSGGEGSSSPSTPSSASPASSTSRARAGSNSPSMRRRLSDFMSSNSAVTSDPDVDKVLCLVLRKATSDGSILQLQTKSRDQCGVFVRCFRRMVHQEREQSRILGRAI